tara:strand:- start:910 stop:2046 length:1137 start_codon:yes stop_codon:yes gene_type:complete
MKKIDFNKPYLTGLEFKYIKDSTKNLLSGNGNYTKKCETEIKKICKSEDALLTNSCTSSLEIIAHLMNISPGDEIIVPSYTFVSTANAFLLRGAKIVFVDIDLKTLNIDINSIEKEITKKTKGIVVVHYAGVSCDMKKLIELANQYSLLVIEDSAQAMCSTYKGKHCGTIGDFGAISFHATKNINCGEGGAVLINKNPKLFERAEIIREKGTNRSNFIKGKINKYTWVDIGSSYVNSELNSAYLLAQLQNAKKITSKRMKIWNKYHTEFLELEKKECFKRPSIPNDCSHNAHIYYILTKSKIERTNLINFLLEKNIEATFHYLPLHLSKLAKKFFQKKISKLLNTISVSERIVRLPLWPHMTYENELVIKYIKKFYNK